MFKVKFNLMELIVVIAILGILAAIIVPNVKNLQGEATKSAVLSDMRSLQTSVDMYKLDHYGRYPVLSNNQPSLGLPGQLDFGKLFPRYIRGIPKYNNMYYWVDYMGVVWASTVDSPTNIVKNDENISWEYNSNVNKYSIHEVDIDNQKNNLIDTVEGVSEFSYADYNKDKIYLISASDSRGFKTPPVKSGYKGINILDPNTEQGQTVDIVTFIKEYGGSHFDSFNSVDKTADGGYIAVGYSWSSDGDLIGKNKGSEDAIIAKFNSNGEKEWIKNYGGSSRDVFNCVQTTTDGGYIVVGSSISSDGDLESNNGGRDAIIAKFNSNGEKEWFKNYGGSRNDFFKSVQQTIDGGYMVAGYSYSNDGDFTGNGAQQWAPNGIVMKLNPNGEKEWFKDYGGSGEDEFNSIQKTINGNYIVAGGFESSDGDMLGKKNEGWGSDFVMLKIDANGQKIWFENYGGSSLDIFHHIIITSNGDIVAVGLSFSDDGDLSGKNAEEWQYDAVIAKFDSNGNNKWFKNYGGSASDLFIHVTQTTDGGYVVLGYSYSDDGDFEGTESVFAKLNSNGELEWVKSYDFLLRSILQTTDNGYLAVGSSPYGHITNFLIAKFDSNGNSDEE